MTTFGTDGRHCFTTLKMRSGTPLINRDLVSALTLITHPSSRRDGWDSPPEGHPPSNVRPLAYTMDAEILRPSLDEKDLLQFRSKPLPDNHCLEEMFDLLLIVVSLPNAPREDPSVDAFSTGLRCEGVFFLFPSACVCFRQAGPVLTGFPGYFGWPFRPLERIPAKSPREGFHVPFLTPHSRRLTAVKVSWFFVSLVRSHGIALPDSCPWHLFFRW